MEGGGGGGGGGWGNLCLMRKPNHCSSGSLGPN